MFKNYLKIALRNIWKHRAHSAINIMGLAIGMASVMLILLYVRSETSVDKFHVNLDSIYRLNLRTTNPQTAEVSDYARSPYRMATELAVDFPEWEFVRFIASGNEEIIVDNISYNEDRFTFADDGVFEVFSFDLIHGDNATVLDDPFNGTTAPKAIPGATVEYVITVDNTDAQETLIVVDLPAPASP